MDGDVESLDIEGLEEDLGRLLAVLWRVQWGFGLRMRADPCRGSGTEDKEIGRAHV